MRRPLPPVAPPAPVRPALAGAGLALLALAGAAAAHPHHDTDQQVQLSLGPNGAVMTAMIVPGTADGAAILAHLDADGSGAVSGAEAEAFGAALLADAALTVDGERVPLRAAGVSMLSPEEVRGGTGALAVRAEARFPLGEAPRTVGFTIAHDALAPGWFVQTFHDQSLVAAVGQPVLERPEDGAVLVRVPGP